MSKGIYTAVSGAMAQSAKLDTIANNLANVNTPGFKRDSQLFREYLASYEKEPPTITVPRVPASIESFYDMQGGDKGYVDLDGTSTDFSQGSIKSTGNNLDVAIEGEGFFEVATPDGIRFTRNGSFTINSDGVLVSKQGYPVLRSGAPGQDANGRQIQLNGSHVAISSAGEIFEGEQNIGKLSVVNFGNRDSLQKVGSSMYTIRENQTPEMSNTDKVSIHQGFLEASNVNVIREMTDMIGTTRVFESTQKAIQAYDQMAEKVSNQISKLD